FLIFLMVPALRAAVVASAINFGKGGPFHEVGEKLGAPLLLGGSAVLVLALFTGLNQLVKGIVRKGLKPGTTPFWGPSAFFVGDGMMGLGNPSTRVYRANRPEWIRALAQSNPSQVEGAAYQRRMRPARPAGGGTKPSAT